MTKAFQYKVTDTIDFYDKNAKLFHKNTAKLNMDDFYERFLKLLPKTAHILDAGCGGGRDAKYFLSQGYKVTAFDASKGMVECAKREINQPVLKLRFQKMNFKNVFDGVWACASLLHVPYHETRDVYQRIHDALKPGGIFYASYGYGKDSVIAEGREFYCMNKKTISPYLERLFEVLDIWKTPDGVPRQAPGNDKVWLNFIAKKLY